jgi:Zn-finger nucleic acid-binding protein
LEPYQFERTVVDQCEVCCGVWLDHEEVDEIFGEEKLPARLMEGCLGEAPGTTVPEGHRTCPRCKTFLKLVEVDGIRLDVCSECKGFFADLGELKELAEAAERRFAEEHGEP